MKMFSRFIIGITVLIPFISFSIEGAISGEKPITLITCSYNNKDWYKASLDSVFAQAYDNYRVIYMNDASTDGTGALVEAYVKEKGFEKKFTIMHNEENMGPCYNQYVATHLCQDDEIIVNLDGDDRFAHSKVFAKINEVYEDPNVWLTFGQFRRMPSRRIGFCHPFPKEVVRNGSYRTYRWNASHLRSYYASLAKKIKLEDYKDDNGNFFRLVPDCVMMFPMLDMTGERHKCISEVLYLWTDCNPISEHRVTEIKKIRAEEKTIKSRPRYQRLP